MVKSKVLVATVLFGMLLSTNVNATRWVQNGTLVSDTCVSGRFYFVFMNSYGPVGAPCWWVDQFGNRFNGIYN